MSVFDEAGYVLGDVDRTADEKYPAGRLELWPLARMTHGKDKMKPCKVFPVMDLGGVQVAKCLPAWLPALRAHGFNYWVSTHRGHLRKALEYPHNEELDANKSFDPDAIWARACDHVIGLKNQG